MATLKKYLLNLLIPITGERMVKYLYKAVQVYKIYSSINLSQIIRIPFINGLARPQVNRQMRIRQRLID